LAFPGKKKKPSWGLAFPGKKKKPSWGLAFPGLAIPGTSRKELTGNEKQLSIEKRLQAD
jgi:hypothetical protein